MALRYKGECLLSDFLSEFPITLLSDALEEGAVEERQEVWVSVLMNISQVLVDVGHRFDQQLSVVRGVKDANDCVPHGLS